MSIPADSYDEFKEKAMLSMEEICRQIYFDNRDSIRTKKENVAVKNLILIFDATLRLGIKKGFHATSLRDLCRETGLSMGGLYSYFSCKEHILDMILKQGRLIIKKMLDDALENRTDPKEKLHSALITHLFLSELMQHWFFFAYMETKNLNSEEHKNAMAGELYTENIFVRIIEDGVSSGIFRTDDPVLTASVIKAMLQDWYLKRWKYKKRQVSVERYAEFVISVLDKALS